MTGRNSARVFFFTRAHVEETFHSQIFVTYIYIYIYIYTTPGVAIRIAFQVDSYV